jgi:hypothetical protein
VDDGEATRGVNSQGGKEERLMPKKCWINAMRDSWGCDVGTGRLSGGG